jgi:DNA polymerase-3 subunit gamma/tau
VFDNLLGQDEVSGQLMHDIGSGTLPASLLFAGQNATGKLTAALELSRVLSCQAGGQGHDGAQGSWSCPCPSCSRHRILAHPDLLLMGPRSFPEEIPAALDLLERAPGKASTYFFIRAVRKLGKRFDAALYEGEEARLAKAAPILRDIEERLDLVSGILLGGEGGDEGANKALDSARAILEASRKLEAMVPDTTPVFQVRSAGYWARLAPNGRRKTIVIENADRMLDASRNALLKILEEPPESLEFVLLSSRRNALMATILSRVRVYSFKARGPAEAELVLSRVFKLKAPGEAAPRRGNLIEAYLASERAFPPAEAKRRARGFLYAALLRAEGGPAAAGSLDPALEGLKASLAAEASDMDPGLKAMAAAGAGPEAIGDSALAALAAATKDFGQKDDAFSTAFGSFLAAMAELLGEALRLPGLGPDGLVLIGRWTALLRDAKAQYETFNRSPSLLAEGLLYEMGGE